MSAARHHLSAVADLVLPSIILTAMLIFIGSEIRWDWPAGDAGLRPATTVIAPRSYSFRQAGDYYRDGVALDGPLISVENPPSLEIMTYQVTATEYRRCVDDGACRLASPRRRGTGEVPATGVSFEDAEAYARWLSRVTGESWRLPTIAEWSFAAGDRAVDPAIGGDAGDFTERWLALYEREAELGASALAAPEPRGTFGFNALGVADIGGSVWEWTATCAGRTTLDAAGKVLTQLPSCGVRYLEGRHRTQLSTFIRDARAGGCSTGTPPDNLGFRLVRQPGWLEWPGALPGGQARPDQGQDTRESSPI